MDAVLASLAQLNQRMTNLEGNLNQRMTTLEGNLNQRMTTLESNLNQRMTTLESNLNQKVDDLAGKVDGLSGKVDTLDQKIIVINRNFMVRMENSNVSQNEMSVMPLYSMRTGAEIPGCPATLAEFNALTASEAGHLLREADEIVPRGREQRIRKLKLAFGISWYSV
ncbi:hypothetical protein BDV29DRAFT_156849 [Aspergillus leporis]|uniref:Uncharacterized protein n=1 Tax=Aspergillus leporis TaxID=41062 RepID=A0A5N5X0W9_9EURO|nr:hypothetical protein BDV29DRAFT_156849 [Aspergillus leporis]